MLLGTQVGPTVWPVGMGLRPANLHESVPQILLSALTSFPPDFSTLSIQQKTTGGTAGPSLLKQLPGKKYAHCPMTASREPPQKAGSAGGRSRRSFSSHRRACSHCVP